MNGRVEFVDVTEVVPTPMNDNRSEALQAAAPENWLAPEFVPALVSVVLSTHNRADLLGATLESILRQTYPSVETVVVDDGSTDDTPAVLAHWQGRFERERGWRLECLRQENQGGPAGRNRAARHARGEYLNFFDDDDLLAHDKIASQIAALRTSGADVVYGPHVFFRQEHGCYWLAPGINLEPRRADEPVMISWLHGWEWALQSSLATRHFLQQVGPWDESLARGQDLDYKLRMLRGRPRMQHAPDGATFIRRHNRSVSHQGGTAALDSLLAGIRLTEQVSLEQLSAECCAKSLAQYWGGHALRFFEQGAATVAQHCLDQALRIDHNFSPEKLGAIDRAVFRVAGLKGVGAWRRARRRLAGALRACGLRAGASRPLKQLPLAPVSTQSE